MLRLHTDLALSTGDRTVDMLGPLLAPRDPPQWVHRPHGAALARRYAALARSSFELCCDLATCDVAVLPFGWDLTLVQPSLVAPGLEFCRAAEAAGKAVLVFVDGDDHVPEPTTNAVVFRTSLDRSRRGPRDVALPAWIPDPGVQPPRAHRARATVGFCGQAYPLGLPWTRVDKRAKFHGRVALTSVGVVERLGKHPAFGIRPRSVRALQRATAVEPRVTLRPAMTRLDLDTATEQRLHEEFVGELCESDYVLCVRGEGNYSFRLYESLAAGRVPVYIDTDAVLPLESRVPWRELCVVVPAAHARRAPELVADAHAAMDDDTFAARQADCRAAWERWVSMEGFFGVVRDELERLVDDVGQVRADDLAAALR